MNEPPKTSIGPYAISRRLPGPGESYQARSPDGDRVLLRVFGTFPHADSLERAQHELEVCSALEHRALLRPLSVLVDEGKLVLAYPHLDTTRLALLLKRPFARSKLLTNASLYIGQQIASALAQAHAAADAAGDPSPVCHGHLSPQHVYVSAGGEISIDGFGLAALVGTEELAHVAGYQAPEEASGGKITPRGDVYSAAALLWCLLVGEDPESAAGGRLGIDKLVGRAPPPVVEALGRALEPSVAKRKLTSMELDQILGEATDVVVGMAGAADAAKALAQGGRTLAGTGPALLGMVGRGVELSAAAPPVDAPAVPPAAELAPAPAPPVAAAQGTEQAKAALVAKAAAGGPGKGRLRQATLLGAWPMAPAASKETAGPRQSAARTAAEPAAPAVAPGAAVIRPSVKPARVPGLPDLDWEKPPTSQPPPKAAGLTPKPAAAATPAKAAATPTPPAAAAAAPPVAAGETPRPGAPRPASLAPRPAVSKPPPEAATPPPPAAISDESELPTVERPLPPPPSSGAEHDEDSALEAALFGATVTAPVAPAERAPAPPTPTEGPTLLSKAPTPVAAAAATPEAAAPAGVDALLGQPAAPAPASPALSAEPLPAPPLGATAPSSPWRGADASAAAGPAEPKPLSWPMAVLLAVGTAIVVLAVGLWWTRRQVVLTEVAAPEPPRASASASASSATEPAPSTSASASATAAPEPTASATASAAGSADDDPRDGSELAPGLGLLRVTFTGPPDPDANVFLYSKPYGPVGKKLEVPCGRTYVRVGKMPGPAWLSKGIGQDLRCKTVTELTLAP